MLLIAYYKFIFIFILVLKFIFIILFKISLNTQNIYTFTLNRKPLYIDKIIIMNWSIFLNPWTDILVYINPYVNLTRTFKARNYFRCKPNLYDISLYFWFVSTFKCYSWSVIFNVLKPDPDSQLNRQNQWLYM